MLNNVLYLSLGEFNDFNSGSVHIDVVKELSKYCKVYLICKLEKRNNKATYIENIDGIDVLHVRTGNIKNVGFIEKGVSTVLIERQFKKAINKYLKHIKFDLVLYETPPITFVKVIKYIKKRDNARTYLMLKDIFPQNAIDLGIMKKTGVLGLIYKYFRRKEKKIYKISDKIGCMSQANIDYVLNNNKVSKTKIELFPNSIYTKDMSISSDEKLKYRKKYSLPLNKKIFVYGGNLGKPQGIDFLIECLDEVKKNKDSFFLIVGNGTEYEKLNHYYENNKNYNFMLMRNLPKNEYDQMIACCDVGMIFLDYRFTIPNFPSRLLSYMQVGLPVLACTDKNTDVGKTIVEGGFGWKCESNDSKFFANLVNSICHSNLSIMKEKELKYLFDNYSIEKNIRRIVD